MFSNSDISVVVPAYKRPRELEELLTSVLLQKVKPGEVIVCEDDSSDKLLIEEICAKFVIKLQKFSVKLRHLQNARNLGYDKNLRKCIESSTRKWALILGNDDLLLSGAISDVICFINNHDVDFISRSFLRFSNDINDPKGVSSIYPRDTVFRSSESSSNMIFRSAGFVGGLVVNVEFCKKISTDIYDGSLYYQIYLASCAFCERGIGYISSPIVGGRTDNPPMFGSVNDKDVHIPGGYTAEGRAAMWAGVLKIVKDVQERYNVDLLEGVSKELEIRQSFHVFEMNAGVNKEQLYKLKKELKKLDLFSHIVPKLFYMLNFLLGKKSAHVYRFIRKLLQ